MDTIEVRRRDITEAARTFAPRPAADATIVEGEARLVDAETGETVGLQVVPRPEWGADVARSLRRIRWNDASPSTSTSSTRLSGIKSENATFGYTIPVPLRRRYGCGVCRFNDDYPRLTERLTEFARLAWHLFHWYAPEQAEDHRERVEAIDQAWRIGGSPWTSGIVNRTAALQYHRDSGNVRRAWSAMLGLRRETDGGLLHLPEWGVHLAIPDGSVTLFDGQGVLHGVTPIDQAHDGAYRYTIVLYAKAGMAKCGTAAEELNRARRARTKGEDRQAELIAGRRG